MRLAKKFLTIINESTNKFSNSTNLELVKVLIDQANKLYDNDRRVEFHMGKEAKIPKYWKLIDLSFEDTTKYPKGKPKYCYQNAFEISKNDSNIKLVCGMFIEKYQLIMALKQTEIQDYQYHSTLGVITGGHAFNIINNKILDTTFYSDYKDYIFFGEIVDVNNFDIGMPKTDKSVQNYVESKFNTGILIKDIKI